MFRLCNRDTCFVHLNCMASCVRVAKLSLGSMAGSCKARRHCFTRQFVAGADIKARDLSSETMINWKDSIGQFLELGLVSSDV